MTRRWFPAKTAQRIPGQSVTLGVTLTPLTDEPHDCPPAIVRDPDGNIVAELRCGEEYQYSCPPCETVDVTWWPLASTEFSTDVNPFFPNATGDELFSGFDPYSLNLLGGDWGAEQFPSPLDWSELPVAEVWTYHSNEWGDHPKTYLIINTGGVAAELSITATQISGETRAFALEATHLSFALVSFAFDDPDGDLYDSTYDVHVGSATLRAHIRSTYVAF